MGLKIMINREEIELKDILDCLNDVWKIVNNKCKYCKEKGLNDVEKLELIREILRKRLNFK